jgi:hypothetical protein
MISMLRRLGLMSLCVVVVSGCTKDADKPGLAASSSDSGVSRYSTDPSESPYYGDTILSVTGTSYQVFSPLSRLGTGTYVSWPKGLYVNPQTGVIDAYRSDKGARYNIGFIKEGSADTVFSQVILSGITYPDGIYLMGSADTLIHPIAVSAGNTNSFETRSEDREAHLVIDPSSGSINLSQSVLAGLFGDQPQDGDSKKVTISYKLADAAEVQQTTIELHYYTDLSHVPAALVTKSLEGRSSIPGINSQSKGQNTVGEATLTTFGGSPNTVTVAPKTPTTGTATTATKTTTPAPAPVSPRPPQLVIVNVGHH